MIKEKRNILTDDNFNLLREAQAKILSLSEFSPSMRMMVNEIVTRETIDAMTQKVIERMSQV